MLEYDEQDWARSLLENNRGPHLGRQSLVHSPDKSKKGH